MARRGRPPKLTPALQAAIVKQVEIIGDLTLACQKVGVPRSTANRWRAAGAKQKTGIYRNFLDAVEGARDVCEHRLLLRIERSKDWRAHAWRLKHMRPKKYADTQRLEHSGSAALGGHSTLIVMPDNGRIALPEMAPAKGKAGQGGGGA